MSPPDVEPHDDPDDRKSEDESSDEDPQVAAESAARMVILHPHAHVLSSALYSDDDWLGWDCDYCACNSVDQKACWYAAPPDDVRQQDDA